MRFGCANVVKLSHIVSPVRICLSDRLEDNFPANLKIVEVIRSVAEQNRASLAQVARAWLLAQGEHIVPIPGVKRIASMEDSARAAELDLS